MNIFIKQHTDYYSPLLCVLKIMEKNKSIRFNFIDTAANADIIFDHTDNHSQTLALPFYKTLTNQHANFSNKIFFPDSQFIHTSTGEIDYAATIFYMINCLQERNPKPDDLDNFGRFKYEATYQNRFGSIEHNLVQHCIDELVKSWKITNAQDRKSAFSLSHDVDTMYGSFLQDGFWALKNGRLDIIFRLIANECMRKPAWRNIDQIINIHSEYDLKSTFFWLVNKGRGELNIKNADYAIYKENDLLNRVQQQGFVNGIHKSCTAMEIDEEIKKYPAQPVYNRYHFLKFLPHTDWQKINDSKLNFDSSLGFSETTGFRNSFGMPFQPYDFNEKKPFHFVEAPLNIMDGIYHRYMGIPVNEIAKRVIDFYEANPVNCMFSVCWHNNYFTNYKFHGYLDQYKKILAYIHENKIECLTPDEVIDRVKIAG